MRNILFNHLGVFVVDAGKNAAGGCVEHHKMVGIRANGGFILGNTFVCVDHAHSPFASSVHAPAQGVYCLDDGTA